MSATITIHGPKEFVLKMAEIAAAEIGRIQGFEKYSAGFELLGVAQSEAISTVPTTSAEEKK